MIPAEAVEAAHEQLDGMGAYVSKKYVRAALEEALPHILAPLLAFADERDNMIQAAKAEAWEEGREYGIDECAGDVTGGINPYGKAAK